MELHTFRFQGLHLTGFNPVVKYVTHLQQTDTNFTHESMMYLYPPKTFCGFHADTELHMFQRFIFKNIQ